MPHWDTVDCARCGTVHIGEYKYDHAPGGRAPVWVMRVILADGTWPNMGRTCFSTRRTSIVGETRLHYVGFKSTALAAQIDKTLEAAAAAAAAAATLGIGLGWCGLGLPEDFVVVRPIYIYTYIYIYIDVAIYLQQYK